MLNHIIYRDSTCACNDSIQEQRQGVRQVRDESGGVMRLHLQQQLAHVLDALLNWYLLRCVNGIPRPYMCVCVMLLTDLYILIHAMVYVLSKPSCSQSWASIGAE